MVLLLWQGCGYGFITINSSAATPNCDTAMFLLKEVLFYFQGDIYSQRLYYSKQVNKVNLSFLLEELSLIDKNKYEQNDEIYSEEDIINSIFNELHIDLDNITSEQLETLLRIYNDFIILLQGPQGETGRQGKSAYEIYLETVPYNKVPLTKQQWLESLKGDPIYFEELTEEQLEALRGPEGHVDTSNFYTKDQVDYKIEQIELTQGNPGQNGKSAYELAVENGFEGTIDEWLDSLKMTFDELTPEQKEEIRGIQGIQGLRGEQGVQGIQGIQGPKGDKGDQGEKGDKGDKGDPGIVQFEEFTPEQIAQIKGDIGPQGKSAYEIAQEQGFTGSKQEWLDSLKAQGLKILGIYQDSTILRSEQPQGQEGDAYAVGTYDYNEIYIWDTVISDWRNIGTLQGVQGPQGPQGASGADGAQGPIGVTPSITINASVSNTTGIPQVNVTSGGTLENPIYNFEFQNLKGEQGDPALSSGENNIIEIVKVNGTPLTPDSQKAVDITIPTDYISPLNIDQYIQQYIDRIRLLEMKVQQLEGGGDQPQEFNYFYVGITKPSSLSEANIVESYQNELTFTNPSTTEKCYVYVLTNNNKTVNFYDPSDLSTAATKIEDTTTIPNYKITNMEVRLAKGGNIIIKIS